MLPNDHPSLDVRLPAADRGRQADLRLHLFPGPEGLLAPGGPPHRGRKDGGDRPEAGRPAARAPFLSVDLGGGAVAQLLPVRRRCGRRRASPRSRSGSARRSWKARRPCASVRTIPQLLPQRSTVKDILGNSQRYFYSLRLGGPYPAPGIREDAALEKREVVDVPEDPDVRALSGYYLPREDRIREIYDPAGYPGPDLQPGPEVRPLPAAAAAGGRARHGPGRHGLPGRAGVRGGPRARGRGRPRVRAAAAAAHDGQGRERAGDDRPRGDRRAPSAPPPRRWATGKRRTWRTSSSSSRTPSRSGGPSRSPVRSGSSTPGSRPRAAGTC